MSRRCAPTRSPPAASNHNCLPEPGANVEEASVERRVLKQTLLRRALEERDRVPLVVEKAVNTQLELRVAIGQIVRKHSGRALGASRVQTTNDRRLDVMQRSAHEGHNNIARSGALQQALDERESPCTTR